MKFRLNLLLAILCGLATTVVHAQAPGGSTYLWENPRVPVAQETQPSMLVPIGGGYAHLETGFLPAVIARAASSPVRILVLPFAYGIDPELMPSEERAQNVKDAETRRAQIEAACRELITTDNECSVILAPVFVRKDAEIIPLPQFFPDDLAGIFLLGGDQTVAMRILGGTPLEDALEQAYRRGVVIGGTSAGAAVQSRTMLGGYRSVDDPRVSLRFGAVDLWLPPERSGLPFGISTAVIDQHFYQQGRIARLLNTITLPEAPHLGIGLDAYTGAQILNGDRLENVFGGYTVTILDARTYHSADAAQYRGPENILGLRNVLFHLLPAGPAAYDLSSRTFSEAAALEPRLERNLRALNLPPNAGPLYLGGGLEAALEGSPILNEFVNASGGRRARILVIALAFEDRQEALRTANRYHDALGVDGQVRIVVPSSPALREIPDDFTGIVLVGSDASLLDLAAIPAVRPLWLTSTPVLADGAAASLVGSHFAALAPAPVEDDQAEPFTQGTFIQGGVEIRRGLAFVEAMIEPRVLGGNRWGNWVSLAYQHPSIPSIAISEGAGIAVRPAAAQILGSNGVLVLDLRLARLFVGENQAYGIANGLVDVFAPGDYVTFQPADRDAAPVRAATPVLPTPTQLPPTATVAPIAPATIAPPTVVVEPSLIPQATATRMILSDDEEQDVLPPPTDSRLLHSMIALGVAMFVTLLVGLWINRGRMNLR